MITETARPKLEDHRVLALTVNDALSSLGISRKRLYEEIGCGRIKTRKAGRRTLIEVEELRSWLKSLPHSPVRGVA